MKLQLAVLKQTPKACGVYSLLMVLGYHNIKATVDDISKIAKIGQSGVTEGKLGIAALEKGMKATIIGGSDKYFPISRIKGNSLFAREIWALSEFMEKGGKLIHKKPTVGIIEKELAEKRPVLMLVDASCLRKKIVNKRRQVGHFIVITGFDERNFFVADPDQESEGEYSYGKKFLLQCCLKRKGGWLIMLRK